jgi:hypothetical protein
MKDSVVIEDFNIPYKITREGGIYNYKTNRQLKYSIDGSGYAVVKLRKGKDKFSIRVHRLVAKCFLPLPLSAEHKMVNHINGIKTDNRVENLEWVSSNGNVEHYLKLIYALKKERDGLINEISVLKNKKQLLLEQ